MAKFTVNHFKKCGLFQKDWSFVNIIKAEEQFLNVQVKRM